MSLPTKALLGIAPNRPKLWLFGFVTPAAMDPPPASASKFHQRTVHRFAALDGHDFAELSLVGAVPVDYLPQPNGLFYPRVLHIPTSPSSISTYPVQSTYH
jgi:hypothetical protein